MRIKYGFIILFLFAFCKLTAQENTILTFSPWLQSFYNSGAMGEKENHLNFTGILRQQTILMRPSKDPSNNTSNPNPTDKPEKTDVQVVLLNIDSYIKKIRGAVGVTFIKDKIGYQDNIGFQFGYATKFRIRSGKLGIGLQFGFLNQNTKTVSEKYKPNQDPDPTVTEVESFESFLDFDMNLGIHYKAPTWYVGVSCNQLLGGIRIPSSTNSYKPVRQLYFTGGYIWNLHTAVPWSIEPHILIRSHFSTWQLNVMTLARYNGILWFGLSYQNLGVAALFGAVPFYNNTNEYLKGLELGIAYTFSTSKISYISGGGWGDFELVVRYGFNFYKEKTLTGYGSTRHLYKNQY
jgi:type IX secretion system PorP/SprF family membrane protein